REQGDVLPVQLLSRVRRGAGGSSDPARRYRELAFQGLTLARAMDGRTSRARILPSVRHQAQLPVYGKKLASKPLNSALSSTSPHSIALAWRRRVRRLMSTNGKTVLLVEDNEDNRIVYSTILRHFGYSVTEALNGEEGIAKARSEHPDLILMDISIPVIDGWEATQVLKHDPQTRQIPIIALTAHALASDREKAMEVGCDGYLAKPCEPRAVVAEVQRFLGKDNGRSAAA